MRILRRAHPTSAQSARRRRCLGELRRRSGLGPRSERGATVRGGLGDRVHGLPGGRRTDPRIRGSAGQRCRRRHCPQSRAPLGGRRTPAHAAVRHVTAVLAAPGRPLSGLAVAPDRGRSTRRDLVRLAVLPGSDAASAPRDVLHGHAGLDRDPGLDGMVAALDVLGTGFGREPHVPLLLDAPLGGRDLHRRRGRSDDLPPRRPLLRSMDQASDAVLAHVVGRYRGDLGVGAGRGRSGAPCPGRAVAGWPGTRGAPR